MNLPDLTWQMVYGRLAWAVVLAALAGAFWPRARALGRIKLGLLLGAAAGLMALPGAASPAYWLALAMQWPSALLCGLCLAKLYGAWHGRRDDEALSTGLAGVIAVAGTVLYLDAIGLLSVGIYYWGFGPYAAPALALLLAGGAALAAIFNRARPQALAVLLAMVLFATLRLPTGNLWDALLDPLLWAWCLMFLGARWWRWWTLERGWRLRVRQHGRN